MSKLVKPQNTLKQKVGHGGFKEEDLKKAQKSIEENTVDFKPIAIELLGSLDKTLLSIQKGTTDIKTSLGAILDPIMQLRAQGSLFHYPSITHISDVVVDFLDTEKSIDKNILEMLVAYKKAVDALLSLEIKDEKDKVCLALVDELQNACIRYQQKK
ncbi:MAG: hypothetical protein DHS20C02_07490 [Micavibrio sp.]|nr:MAG: hypothetical protein DHS20C02_07490 [Micavibrio sp.]